MKLTGTKRIGYPQSVRIADTTEPLNSAWEVKPERLAAHAANAIHFFRVSVSEYRYTSTLHNVILCGIKFAWGQKRTLEIFRELGGEIRDVEFHRIYRETWAQIQQITTPRNGS